MTNAFSSMEYPHWLIVAGAALLILGLIGLAWGQRRAEVELNDAAIDQGAVEPQADLAESQGADRKAKLEEEKRERWAAKDRGAKEPWNDRPKIYSKELK